MIKTKNFLTAAVMGLALGTACNSAMAASVALSVNEITNFSMSSTSGTISMTGFTFSNDTAATESGGTGGANTMDAPAACIGDCVGWDNQFYSHTPSAAEFSYGDAKISNVDILSGTGAASSIGEVVVNDGIAHASGSNVLTSIFLNISDVTTTTMLDFGFDVNALMQTSVSGTGLSSAANMFFNITLTDDADPMGPAVFSWSPEALNLGIAANNSYKYIGSLGAMTAEIAGGAYTLNIKMENQVNAAAVVPVPAAVWLFGSGLLALAGIARRKA